MATHYSAAQLSQIATPFHSIETIDQNFSQSYQDLFVLTMLDGLRNGVYMEVGSNDPVTYSNTWLLENFFAWRGVSVDIEPKYVQKFSQQRRNPVVCADATLLDYDQLFEQHQMPRVIDYLQVDCEPSENSFAVLKRMPWKQYQFRVITFEHDDYADVSRKVKMESRSFMRDLGYILIAGDISDEGVLSYEDWWIHPQLVSRDRATAMMAASTSTIPVESYMFGQYRLGL